MKLWVFLDYWEGMCPGCPPKSTPVMQQAYLGVNPGGCNFRFLNAGHEIFMKYYYIL